MSKNVKVNGKVYEDVSFVKLDLADGSGVAVFEDFEQRNYATEMFVESYVDNAMAKAGGLNLIKAENGASTPKIFAGSLKCGGTYTYYPSDDGLEDIVGVPIVETFGEYTDGGGVTQVIPISWQMRKGENPQGVVYTIQPTVDEALEHDLEISLYSNYKFVYYSM